MGSFIGIYWEKLSSKINSARKNDELHLSVRTGAWIIYVLGVTLKYLIWPVLLGGMSYLFFMQKEYLLFTFVFILFIAICIVDVLDIKKYLINRKEF
ncbi:hypothetical protein [Breznakia pachnodae]|uniref:H+/Cl- antiporter ClcA n=1 Tax=Breznakia pachnodae TaxID=265178 RepID=A0ABU0E4N9_9FIRM|nr:hypothetical protein [Breznakia pachnodae]MDQ0361686.1 H+/Cl- antiporter ClcA [Breznakia pachnodae]